MNAGNPIVRQSVDHSGAVEKTKCTLDECSILTQDNTCLIFVFNFPALVDKARLLFHHLTPKD